MPIYDQNREKSEKTVIFQFFEFFQKFWIFMAQIPPKQVEGTTTTIFKTFGPKKVQNFEFEHRGGVFTRF